MGNLNPDESHSNLVCWDGGECYHKWSNFGVIFTGKT